MNNSDNKTLLFSDKLVSIGIPAYNRAEGLARTLASLEAQTYKTLDIIISDNCSPDPEVKGIAEKLRLAPKLEYF